MDNIIELKNVSYLYDEENEPTDRAVDGIDLTISQGEFVGIIGHNGSGKSTLAKLFNGLLLPNEGDVFVLDYNTRDDDTITQVRRNVGMVFQNPDNQMVATIVEEDVAFGAENLGLDPKEIRRVVDESLKAVDMYEFKDKKPHQLSGGQKQRIAIAGVLAMHPNCIIFDESTAMLDPIGRNEVLDTMLRLNKEDGVTIILISHYMEELVHADRIIIMERGHIAMQGSPKEIFSESDKLKQLRLNVPEIVEIAEGLRRGGMPLREGILTAKELVDELCQLK